MTEATIAYIGNMMESLSIPYAFMEWRERPPQDCYFVGDYIETATTDLQENGHAEFQFILRGFSRESWTYLEHAKRQIERRANVTTILDDGTGLAIFYANGEHVPTGDAELKGIKINLTVQEWRVN